MGQTFKTRRLVEFSDTDMAGIAHFSAFFRWMESAEHALLRSTGLSVFDIPAEVDLPDGASLSFPRVKASCDYRSPARCEDELDVAVTIGRLGAKSVTYKVRFSLDGKELAEGEVTSVCCVIQHGKPPASTPIPAEVADKLRPFVAS
ncbi:1,4-dihydroxy-2-naphthoyl-CoA hydrolase [Pseudobythopirellula maris]|uniref:1,4-dihydroxy-2-naphthoyl-CoA hydrolase n=1 Tax=Pseudobythopirellula maris TaxID=2527991 RepID=A0A5C5ZJ96_9BACT|nr:thioesterase family protein [Pseudobythopirellula maris]TWT87444.1 1,4-dihydroxy-2-naphthoyl-CoA hydrolase [Pseudobythopirellula maris]